MCYFRVICTTQTESNHRFVADLFARTFTACRAYEFLASSTTISKSFAFSRFEKTSTRPRGPATGCLFNWCSDNIYSMCPCSNSNNSRHQFHFYVLILSTDHKALSPVLSPVLSDKSDVTVTLEIVTTTI